MGTGKMTDLDSSLALQENVKTQQEKYYGLRGIKKKWKKII